jgi:hypothetical protein
MKYYKIEPEVPASFGTETIFNRSVIPMEIESLHLLFEGWLGSEIMELSPVFFVSLQMALKIEKIKFSGLDCLENIKAEKSENFEEMYPNKAIPSCKLLRISGIPYVDDMGIDNGYLIVSERVNDLLNQFDLSDVDIEEVKSSQK